MHLDWQGKKFNILDCPGYADFISEAMGALRVSDLAVVTVHANHGVGVGTDAVWKCATENGIPKVIVVNAFDKEETDFDKSLAQLREHFGERVFPLAVPVNAGPGLQPGAGHAAQRGHHLCDRQERQVHGSAGHRRTGRAGEAVAQPAHRIHCRVRRRADGEVLRPGRLVGGGNARRLACGDPEAGVRAGVLHGGRKQYRRRTADGFHCQIRIVAGGPAQGGSRRCGRQPGGSGVDQMPTRCSTSSRR